MLQASPSLALLFLWSDPISPIHYDIYVLLDKIHSTPPWSSNCALLFLLYSSLSIQRSFRSAPLQFSCSTLIRLVFSHLPSISSDTIWYDFSPQLWPICADLCLTLIAPIMLRSLSSLISLVCTARSDRLSLDQLSQILSVFFSSGRSNLF